MNSAQQDERDNPESIIGPAQQDEHDNPESIIGPTQLMNNPNPLAIPEVLFIVGQHLDHLSLATCLQTCHFWHDTLLPSLWATTTLWPQSSRYGQPALDTVQKHAAHIRKLVLRYRNSVDYPENIQLTCTNLTRLTLARAEDLSYRQRRNAPSVDTPTLYTFVQRHYRTLEEVSTLLNEDGTHMDRDLVGLLDALVHCPRLTRLMLANDLTIHDPTWWVSVFESLCSHLKVVSFMGNRSFVPASIMEISTTEWSNFKGPNRIQDLSLIHHGMAAYPVHIWILQQCTDLVRLLWTTKYLDPERLLQDFGRIIQSGRSCQRIEDLSLHYLGVDRTFPTQEFAGLLKWMAPLVRLDLRGSSFDTYAWESLRSIPHHLASLKVLDLSTLLPGRAIHDILCTVPQLTDLKAGVVRDTDILEDGRDWVCMGMRRLDVSLDITERASHPLILSRLSKLTRLEMISYHSHGFGKGRGGPPMTSRVRALKAVVGLNPMQSLSPLQSLREMRRIEGTFSMDWGVAEIRWVLDHWPRLELPSRADLRKRLDRETEKGGRDVFLSWINS